MQKGCSKCKEKFEQGKIYIDEDTGVLCATLEEKYEKPKNTLVLVPFICTECGTTNWKTIDTREKK